MNPDFELPVGPATLSWDKHHDCFIPVHLSKEIDREKFYVVEDSGARGLKHMRIHGPFTYRQLATRYCKGRFDMQVYSGVELASGAVRLHMDVVEFVEVE